MKECDYNPGDTIWYVLEKWFLGDDGEMEHRCTYYLVGDEIVWFEEMKRDRHDRCCWLPESYDYSSESRNLDLPVPFEVGDIVMMNSTPFGEIGFAIVLEKAGAEGFSQGLHIRVLYYNHGWKITWLDSWKGSTDCNMPHLSPLYSMVRGDFIA